MFASLGTTPMVMLATGLAAGIAAMSGIVTALGVGPRSADVLFALFFASLSGYWIRLGWRESAPARSIGLTANVASDPPVARARRALSQWLVALLFVSLGLWFAVPLWREAGRRPWEACATIVSSCGAAYCARPLDDRGRFVTTECVQPADATGLFRLSSLNIEGYMPVSIQIECADRPHPPVPLRAAAFDRRCREVMEVP